MSVRSYRSIIPTDKDEIYRRQAEGCLTPSLERGVESRVAGAYYDGF
ncbi:MAG: hypothetical protein ACOX0A_09885 [Thermoguttaceae bacterium]